MELKDKVFLRSGHNYDMAVASLAVGLDCAVDPDTGEELVSLTQQSFAEECDINEIVRRFGLTGEMPQSFAMPMAGDFTGISDFHSAVNMVVQAQEEFETLPAELRKRFANDPGELIAFLGDERNREEAVKLGLVNKPVEKTRDVVQAVDELAAKLAPVAAK